MKIYVGKGWRRAFDNGGEVVNLSLKVEDLLKLPKDEYGNISVTVAERREPDERSKATHSVYHYEK